MDGLVEPPVKVDQEGGGRAGLEELEAALADLENSVYHLVRSNFTPKSGRFLRTSSGLFKIAPRDYFDLPPRDYFC